MRPEGDLGVKGFHHITAMAGAAQANLDFYAGVLGLRLVKRSVNQDEPTVYHLFYADAEGRPGTDLTFFPWPNLAPARPGAGWVQEVGLAIPPGSLPYWRERLLRYRVPLRGEEEAFGEKRLLFQDPDGLLLSLVEAEGRAFTPWERSPVPEAHQIQGLHHARALVGAPFPTAYFLTRVLGFREVGEEGGWRRFASGGPGFLEVRAGPNLPPGRWGRGGVHHLAWRTLDQAQEEALMERIRRAGIPTTPVIDRFWFRSVYFREPGGVLFELATDGPGFAVDEDPAHLGERLVLPPWLEGERVRLEALLPPLRLPDPEAYR